MLSDEGFMQVALQEAQRAAEKEEVPVGAVLVLNNEIIAQAHNQTITLQDPSAHAEILVLREAGRMLHNHRLLDTTLYVTLEPCAMCLSALVQARVKRVVFGAKTLAPVNHHFELEGGVLADECSMLLQSFFKARR